MDEEALKKQLAQAKSIDEVVEIMNANGFDVTKEMLSSLPADGELEEGSLEGVAGGATGPWGISRLIWRIISHFL